ncbi:hypothetical protein GQ54DRAFT_271368 [Martensiomyces pterosporus]|nr:hypothetical protein GQ54DRAFT_271368 [Martensiomyces pterosporus]
MSNSSSGNFDSPSKKPPNTDGQPFLFFPDDSNVAAASRGASEPGDPSHLATPAHNNLNHEQPAVNVSDLRKRRDGLVDALSKSENQNVSFEDLMSDLELLEPFEKFSKDTPSLFSAAAHKAAVFEKDGLRFNDTGRKLLTGEAAFVANFKSLWRAMDAEDKSPLAGTLSKSAYRLVDCQTASVGGNNLKLGVVFCDRKVPDPDFSSVHLILEAKASSCSGALPSEYLGQIADYALHIWMDQPTRVFVPILFMHGRLLDLFVFTRHCYYRAKLGSICLGDFDPPPGDVEDIQDILKKVWFLLALPPRQFGHISDKALKPGCIKILAAGNGSSDGASVEALVEATQPKDTQGIRLTTPVKRHVRLVGRLIHLYRSAYNGKQVVLKLSWTPTDRLPEGAVYEILHSANVPHIPEVYGSGVIKKDVFGYRLEYLILEDCGVPIAEHLKGRRRNGGQTNVLHGKTTNFITQVSSCLAYAYNAGVLHRDISTGNVTVRAGQAYVIDWGYAKMLKTAPSDVISRAARPWGFDKETVAENEDPHGSQTGTSLYMSIQVLMETDQRGVFDDIESFFYVILHSLSLSDNATNETPLGFSFAGNRHMAMLRVGCLACTEYYLGNFGVHVCSPALQAALDAMCRFLFFSGATYIGGNLLGDLTYERVPDRQLAEIFMEPGAVCALVGGSGPGSPKPHGPTPGSPSPGCDGVASVPQVPIDVAEKAKEVEPVAVKVDAGVESREEELVIAIDDVGTPVAVVVPETSSGPKTKSSRQAAAARRSTRLVEQQKRGQSTASIGSDPPTPESKKPKGASPAAAKGKIKKSTGKTPMFRAPKRGKENEPK